MWTNKNNPLNDSIKVCMPRLALVMFFSLFINLLFFVTPLHMLQMYDRVLVSRSEVTLIVLTGLAVGLLMIYGILDGIRNRLLVRAGLAFEEVLGDRLFKIAFNNALIQPQGSSVQAFRDMDALRQFISGAAIIAICDAPWVPIFIAVGFLFHPIFGFISLGGALVICVLAIFNEIATNKEVAKGSNLHIEATNEVAISLRNAEVTKALGMLPGIKQRWDLRRNNSLRSLTTATDTGTIFICSSRSLRMILQTVVLATGAYLAIQDIISPGMMIAASIVMGRALAPVDSMVAQWRSFVVARGAYRRLKELIEVNPAENKFMQLPNPEGHIKLENIFAAPPGSKTVILNNVSMELNPGTVTGFVGPSGCGKSSLLRTIVGVWRPVRGTVRIDDADISQWDPTVLGPYIGYMPQDVELFNGSIAENIARFEEVDSNVIIQAAQKAGVHEMILQMEEGYNTQIGPGGVALSGGQRQRIALARALFGDPKIIVLDEPNASLDTEGEKALINSIIQAKREGVTIIVVSHKPALLMAADTVAVFKGGQLIKRGPRDEILNELSGKGSGSQVPSPANN